MRLLRKKEPEGGVLFGETQQFPRWLRLLLILPVCIVLVVFLLMARYEREDRYIMWIVFSVVFLLELLLAYFISMTRLEKQVTRDGFYFRWAPFQKDYRYLPPSQIEGFGLRKNPLPGYGFHFLPFYGWVYHLSRGEGLELRLPNGKKMFFSTGDPVFFLRAVQELVSLYKGKTGNTRV